MQPITKKCAKCNGVMFRSLFYESCTSKDGLDCYCKNCRKKQSSDWSKSHRKRPEDRKKGGRKPAVSVGEIYGCRKIIERLPLLEKRTHNGIRYVVQCIHCGGKSEVFGHSLKKQKTPGCKFCYTPSGKPAVSPDPKICGTQRNYNRGCRCSDCRKANAEAHRKYRKTVAGKRCVRNTNLRKFGLTEEDYQAMSSRQGHVCAICKKPESKRNQYGTIRLAVDHCHESGAVRDLLCLNCNRALGLMGEDVAAITEMAKYVRRHRCTEV